MLLCYFVSLSSLPHEARIVFAANPKKSARAPLESLFMHTFEALDGFFTEKFYSGTNPREAEDFVMRVLMRRVLEKHSHIPESLWRPHLHVFSSSWMWRRPRRQASSVSATPRPFAIL